MIHKDVLIVGGGPAGSACARRLRQHGLDVLILDKQHFPRLKPCAGWVTPKLFDVLEIEPEDYPLDLTTYTAFKISIKGMRFHIPTRQYAIRRWEFDPWMLQRSAADVETHQVSEIRYDAGRFIVDKRFTARVIVGAGGTHCPVRRTFISPAEPGNERGLIITKEEEFQYDIQDDRCHLWFFEHGLSGYAWYFPKTNGYLAVGIGGTAHGMKDQGITLNEHWERFVNQLAETGLVRDHAFQAQGYSYRLRQPEPQQLPENVFLIGDALGLATADMGEGIVPSIQSGIEAANAIISGGAYSLRSVPRYSIPSILRLRR